MLDGKIQDLGVIQKILLALWILLMALRQMLGYGLHVLAFVLIGTDQAENKEVEYERALLVGERYHSSGRFGERGKSEETGSKRKVYAIHAGYVPGIYALWAECKAQVCGFSKRSSRASKIEMRLKGGLGS